jgi:F420-dependent oxidoreductase-like protein
MPAQVCAFTEPQQGASYDMLLAVAQRAESLGMDGFFRSDHYFRMGSATGLPGPTDAWTTLAGLARDTSRIRLGTLVTCQTFRHPAALAIAAADVDAMSGGRLDFGLGAGWYTAEHEAFGIPFPPLGERFDRLGEQLAIITGLWAQRPGDPPFQFEGRYYQIAGTPAPPRPAHGHIPVIVGGRGPKRTPALAARFAAEYNVSFAPIPVYEEQRRRVTAACEAIGRDPATLRFSAGTVVCCGSDEAEFRHRASAIGREPDELRQNGACGRVDEVADTLARWQDAGVDRLYLQFLDLTDLDHLDLVMTAYRTANSGR